MSRKKELTDYELRCVLVNVETQIDASIGMLFALREHIGKTAVDSIESLTDALRVLRAHNTVMIHNMIKKEKEESTKK